MNADLVNELLQNLRGQFYGDNEKLFHQERGLLLQAVTYPARWFKGREMPYPETRYRELLQKIIMEIKQHGDTGRIRSFGRYFLHAVQQRMTHHGDIYYAEAKALRNQLDDVLSRLKLSDEKQVAAEFIDKLSAVNKIVATRKSSKKAAATTPLQLDFLGTAQPLQRIRR